MTNWPSEEFDRMYAHHQEVLTTMETYGGGFVKALAIAWPTHRTMHD